MIISDKQILMMFSIISQLASYNNGIYGGYTQTDIKALRDSILNNNDGIDDLDFPEIEE